MACREPHSYGGEISESQPTILGNENFNKKIIRDTKMEDKRIQEVSQVRDGQDTIIKMGGNSSESFKMNNWVASDREIESMPSRKQSPNDTNYYTYLYNCGKYYGKCITWFWSGSNPNESNNKCDIIKRKHSGCQKYTPKIINEAATKERNIFDMLQDCHTIHGNEIGFIKVKYNWTQRHLRLEQGLNLIANCKNSECKQFMQGVICPRGMFTDRNGYCPLDTELYKAKCPTCKRRINPDDSFAFGFYECSFQLTYKLMKQREYRMRLEDSFHIFYFRKFRILGNKFEILEAHVSFEETVC